MAGPDVEASSREDTSSMSTWRGHMCYFGRSTNVQFSINCQYFRLSVTNRPMYSPECFCLFVLTRPGRDAHPIYFLDPLPDCIVSTECCMSIDFHRPHASCWVWTRTTEGSHKVTRRPSTSRPPGPHLSSQPARQSVQSKWAPQDAITVGKLRRNDRKWMANIALIFVPYYKTASMRSFIAFYDNWTKSCEQKILLQCHELVLGRHCCDVIAKTSLFTYWKFGLGTAYLYFTVLSKQYSIYIYR
jgi:hypothetical protein